VYFLAFKLDLNTTEDALLSKLSKPIFALNVIPRHRIIGASLKNALTTALLGNEEYSIKSAHLIEFASCGTNRFGNLKNGKESTAFSVKMLSQLIHLSALPMLSLLGVGAPGKRFRKWCSEILVHAYEIVSHSATAFSPKFIDTVENPDEARRDDEEDIALTALPPLTPLSSFISAIAKYFFASLESNNEIIAKHAAERTDALRSKTINFSSVFCDARRTLLFFFFGAGENSRGKTICHREHIPDGFLLAMYPNAASASVFKSSTGLTSVIVVFAFPAFSNALDGGKHQSLSSANPPIYESSLTFVSPLPSSTSPLLAQPSYL
jgi:hypothetical protein